MNKIIEICLEAGNAILSIYKKSSLKIKLKNDCSPLTQADTLANRIICDNLKKLYPHIPILSEESSENHSFKKRKHWNWFFLVDPLDGTKEFIQRNGEFTINIALIQKDRPILGVIHAPALQVTYYAEKDKGAYKISNNENIYLPPLKKVNEEFRIAISRSHPCEKTLNFIRELQKDKKVTTLSAGSALKFGIIAEGLADIYPRFSPTMEWDTAAGHIIIKETNKNLKLINSQYSMVYNKPQLINPGFIVS